MAFSRSTQWGLDTDRAEPWQDRAACRGSDPEIFHPLGEPSDLQMEYAFSFCRRCDVAVECREYALGIHKSPTDLWGVWGGLSQTDMRRLLAARQRDRFEHLEVTCRRCGEVGVKLDGRKLCVDCFHIARRGRYLNKFYNTDPSRVHDPIPARQVERKPRAACGFGHPYNEANTYVSPEGKRQCRQCKNMRRTLRAKVRVDA